MKIKRIVVDELPRGCIDCPLNHSKECGEIKADKRNGAVRYLKKSDERCKIELDIPFG